MWQRVDVNPAKEEQTPDPAPLPVLCLPSNLANRPPALVLQPGTRSSRQSRHALWSLSQTALPLFFSLQVSPEGLGAYFSPFSSLQPGKSSFYSAQRAYTSKRKLCYLEIAFSKKPGLSVRCLTKKRSRKPTLKFKADEWPLCSGQHLSVLSFLGQ